MKRIALYAALFYAALAFGFGAGCKGPDGQPVTLDEQMRFLERGKATGHLTLTTDGRLAVGTETSFYAGAGKSALSFNGDIDFAQPLLRPTSQPVTE